MVKLIITPYDDGRRLDRYLRNYLNLAPLGFLHKSLRQNKIKLNGRKPLLSDILHEHDELKLFFTPDILETLRDGKCPDPVSDNTAAGADTDAFCRIIEENDDCIFAYKFRGVLSQKSDYRDVSLNEVLRNHVTAGRHLTDTDSSFRPSVCSRLDRNTTGLITFAKTYRFARFFQQQQTDGSIGKYYMAVVKGAVTHPVYVASLWSKDSSVNKVKLSRTVSVPLYPDSHKHEGFSGADNIQKKLNTAGRSDGAVTISSCYFPVCTRKNLTLLLVRIFTGKSHQIRAQLKAAGYPVAGDPKYFEKREKEKSDKTEKSGQLLHSWRLVFTNLCPKEFPDINVKRVVTAEPPSEISRLFPEILPGSETLEKNWREFEKLTDSIKG